MEFLSILDLKFNWGTACRTLSMLAPVFFSMIVLSLLLSILYKIINRNPLKRTIIIFAVFAVGGSTFGMLMGSSETPIVASLLPPIITVLAGCIGFFGNKNFSQEFKELLPGAVLLFFCNLLFSVFYVFYRFRESGF